MYTSWFSIRQTVWGICYFLHPGYSFSFNLKRVGWFVWHFELFGNCICMFLFCLIFGYLWVLGEFSCLLRDCVCAPGSALQSQVLGSQEPGMEGCRQRESRKAGKQETPLTEMERLPKAGEKLGERLWTWWSASFRRACSSPTDSCPHTSHEPPCRHWPHWESKGLPSSGKWSVDSVSLRGKETVLFMWVHCFPSLENLVACFLNPMEDSEKHQLPVDALMKID